MKSNIGSGLHQSSKSNQWGEEGRSATSSVPTKLRSIQFVVYGRLQEVDDVCNLCI